MPFSQWIATSLNEVQFPKELQPIAVDTTSDHALKPQ